MSGQDNSILRRSPNDLSQQDCIPYDCYCGDFIDLAYKRPAYDHFMNCDKFQEMETKAAKINEIYYDCNDINSLLVTKIQFMESYLDRQKLFKKNEKNEFAFDPEEFATQEVKFEHLKSLNSKNQAFKKTKTKQSKKDQNGAKVQCFVCKKMIPFNNDDLFYPQCGHMYCVACADELIENSFRIDKQFPKCLYCLTNFSAPEIIEIVGERDYPKLVENIEIFAQNLTLICLKCKKPSEFNPGAEDIESIKAGHHGEKIEGKYKKLYAENCFTCQKCQTSQCRLCEAIPYHVNLDCNEAERTDYCRYCQKSLPVATNYQENIMSDVCGQPECLELISRSCETILVCGHRCGGLKDDKANNDSHLECLNKKCEHDWNRKIRSLTCGFCTEDLLRSPSLLNIECGHAYHENCLERFQRGGDQSKGKRVRFEYQQCPVLACGNEIDLDVDCPVKQIFDLEIGKLEAVKNMVMAELKRDRLDKGHPCQENENSKFFGKPEFLAMSIYRVYSCQACNQYFIRSRVDIESDPDLGKPENDDWVHEVSNDFCNNCRG